MARFARTRRAGRAVKRAATRTITVVRRVGSRAVAGRPGSRRRRAAAAFAGSRGGAMVIAQTKILPGAVAGYAISKFERTQRVKQAKGEKPIIADPTYRLVAELGVLAFAASKTSGMLRDAITGGAGAVGALYEMYNAAEGNPDDAYAKEIKEGRAGI